MTDKPEEAASCPVDHKTREAWLGHARAGQASPARQAQSSPSPPSPPRSWRQVLSAYVPWSSSAEVEDNLSRSSPRGELGMSRVVSSIPRSIGEPLARPVKQDSTAQAPNHETESGVDASGNWVYPSEKMFFEAMKRKGHDARAADMRTIVPIHNAVNERAWKQIQEWEAPYLQRSRCGGAKLESFANKTDRMSPAARFNTILGYTPPFDRHDWVIDRCGTRVDYVIDFYAGRQDARAGPSFYLDVRPKLNTWEGVKMRILRWVGQA